jgi:hypothetical protein
MITSWIFAQGVFVNGIDAWTIVMQYRDFVKTQRSRRGENQQWRP